MDQAKAKGRIANATGDSAAAKIWTDEHNCCRREMTALHKEASAWIYSSAQTFSLFLLLSDVTLPCRKQPGQRLYETNIRDRLLTLLSYRIFQRAESTSTGYTQEKPANTRSVPSPVRKTAAILT